MTHNNSDCIELYKKRVIIIKNRLHIMNKNSSIFSISLIKKTLIIILICAITVLCTLCGFYTYLAITAPIRLPFPYDWPSIYQSDSELGFFHRPDMSFDLPFGITKRKSVSIIHNERGVRVPSTSSTPVREADIVFIGCSQTWGMNVDSNDIYPELVGKNLGVTIANLGVASYGGVSSYLLLKRFWDLNPKIVVYGMWHNHMERNISQYAVSTPCYLPKPHVKINNNSEPILIIPDQDTTDCLEKNMQYVRDLGSGHPEYSFLRDLYWHMNVGMLGKFKSFGNDLKETVQKSQKIKEEATAFVFHQLAKEVKENQAQLVIVYMSEYRKTPMESIPKFLADQATSLDILLVDVTSALQATADKVGKEALAIPEDGHLSALGHKIIAEQIVEHLSYLK